MAKTSESEKDTKALAPLSKAEQAEHFSEKIDKGRAIIRVVAETGLDGRYRLGELACSIMGITRNTKGELVEDPQTGYAEHGSQTSASIGKAWSMDDSELRRHVLLFKAIKPKMLEMMKKAITSKELPLFSWHVTRRLLTVHDPEKIEELVENAAKQAFSVKEMMSRIDRNRAAGGRATGGSKRGSKADPVRNANAFMSHVLSMDERLDLVDRSLDGFKKLDSEKEPDKAKEARSGLRELQTSLTALIKKLETRRDKLEAALKKDS